MKTKTINLYEYKELPEDIKAKVLEKHRDINTDYKWWEFMTDDWEERLEAMGFEGANISFSGFWCQGDGASFTSKRVDLPVFLKSQKVKTRFKAFLPLWEVGDVCASVERISHHYSHENTVRGEVLMESSKDTDNLIPLRNELEALLTETVRKLSREIYCELEKEYEYLTSNEAIVETIEANEYTFRDNGEMEN